MTARWWSGKPLPVADAGLPLKWRNKEQHEAAASAATIFRMLLSELRMAIEPHCCSIWNFALPQNAAITAKFHSSRSEKGHGLPWRRGCWELKSPLPSLDFQRKKMFMPRETNLAAAVKGICKGDIVVLFLPLSFYAKKKVAERKARIRGIAPRYATLLFGAGSPLYIPLWLLSRYLRCEFVPETVAGHDGFRF